jgi:hypothetical protein
VRLISAEGGRLSGGDQQLARKCGQISPPDLSPSYLTAAAAAAAAEEEEEEEEEEAAAAALRPLAAAG